MELALIKDADYDPSIRCSISFFLEQFSQHSQECRVTSKFHTHAAGWHSLRSPLCSGVVLSAFKNKKLFFMPVMWTQYLRNSLKEFLQIWYKCSLCFFLSFVFQAEISQEQHNRGSPCFLSTLNQTFISFSMMLFCGFEKGVIVHIMTLRSVGVFLRVCTCRSENVQASQWVLYVQFCDFFSS